MDTLETIYRYIGWIIEKIIYFHVIARVAFAIQVFWTGRPREGSGDVDNIDRILQGLGSEVAVRTSEKQSKNKSNSGEKHIAAVLKNPNRTKEKKKKSKRRCLHFKLFLRFPRNKSHSSCLYQLT